MAKDKAKPGIYAGIQSCARSLKCQKPEPAGAGCPGEGRRYRIQSRDELVEDENRRSIPGKGPSSPAIGGIGVWREAVNQVQHPVTTHPAGLVPDPVSENAGSDSQAERRDEP